MKELTMKLSSVLSSIISAATLALMVSVAYAEINNYKEMLALERYEEQHQCLSLNLYHEARGDSELGQKAVALVTLNRVHSDDFPDTVCNVIYQARLDSNGNPRRNQCQFSWYCDGRSDTPRDLNAWQQVQDIAHEVMATYGHEDDFTDGALWYHASYVNPYWASYYERTVRIDTHIFYK